MKINGKEYQFVDDPEEIIGEDYYLYHMEDTRNPESLFNMSGTKCASYKNWHLIAKPIK